MDGRRNELIAESLDYFLEHGVAGLSLRPLARKIGTSARMIVYHFGSKDGLITAVMDEVRARIQKSFAGAPTDSRTKPSERAIHAFWAWMIQPSNIRYLRLLFEVQVLAMQNPARYARYLERTSSSWLEIIEASLPQSRRNRIVATLYEAVVDGLLPRVSKHRGRSTYYEGIGFLQWLDESPSTEDKETGSLQMHLITCNP